MYRIREYVGNSSIHGFHYIVEPKRHWTERIFWTSVCCFSGYYTWLFFLGTLYAYQHTAVSFVVETDYLNWNTTFPAVSVCEQESPDKLYDVAKELYGDTRDMNIDFYLRDVLFFDGTCYSCTQCLNEVINCTENFNLIISKIKENCEGLISNCTWNDRPFECCDNFLPLRTESGLCFTINSIQTEKRKDNTLKLVSNRKTGPGVLQLRAFESVKVYIHSEEDVPFVNHAQDEKFLLNWGSVYNMKIQVKEIQNDRGLPLVDISQRKCRLPQENNLDVYNFYSYSACIVNCRSRVQMTLCNCTSHYIPHNKKDGIVTCGVKGLACLTVHAETLRALRKDDIKKLGIKKCDCISSCNEPEYNIILSDTEIKKFDSTDTYGTQITIGLERLPTERYKRAVVRTRLDLLVSIGSTVGLFLGASLLSFVELLYYLFIRMYKFDIKKLQKIKMEFKKKKNPTNNPNLIMVTSKPSTQIHTPRLIRARKIIRNDRFRVF